ncbi:MAG: hypothetical protein JXA23_04140 [Bacteroidales bacterium]|nr:hypothetical protein [Bacteroidales bacterium]
MSLKQTFLSHFEAVEQRLDSSLISPQGIITLKKLCHFFPFDTTSGFGFETRLGDPAPSCDFFLKVTKDSHGVSMLAGENTVAGLSEGIFETPFWLNIAQLFKAWGGGSDLLSKKLDLLWLEFDCTENDCQTIPNIFFKIAGEGDSREKQWQNMLQVLGEIYRILFGIGFPDHLARSLKYCVEALPDGAGLYQTGFMVPRKTEAIRLIITGIREKDLIGYLTKIGWPGEQQVIETMIGRYAPLFDYTVLNIHIGEVVLPFAGMEMYLRRMRQPQWEPRWKDIFNTLVSDNLALEKKCEGLIRFCGKNTKTILYPVQYINGINHLKFVYKPGQPTECKAYFGTVIRE